jgi:hypothetical protein
MADIRKLYPASSALGGTDSLTPPHRESLLIHFRNGDTLSYVYRYVSGIETVGEQRIDIFCNCRNIVRITITGKCLSEIAAKLRANTLKELRESTRLDYARPEETVIEKIEVKKTPQQG